MKNLFKKDGKWECESGSYIYDAIEEAIKIVSQDGQPVEFEFNGTLIKVDRFSTVQSVMDKRHQDFTKKQEQIRTVPVRLALLNDILWILKRCGTTESNYIEFGRRADAALEEVIKEIEKA